MKKNLSTIYAVAATILIIAIIVGTIYLFINPNKGNNKVNNQTQTTNNTNGANPNINVYSELIKEDTVVGTGKEAKPGDTLVVNYTGKLPDGTVFDSSLNPGRTPFEFPLGAGRVIQGWDQGFAGMKEGGKRTLKIPSRLGYGTYGSGSIIKPNYDLVFEVELIEVK